MEDAPALLIGFALGFFGGMLPGLHSNTIISILASMGLSGRGFALMIGALFPAHLVSSFVPSIFFGIPEGATLLCALPGQRMVVRGEGLKALKTVLLSCVLATLAAAALLPASCGFYEAAYPALRPHMGIVLLAITAGLLLRSRDAPRAALILLASGALGAATFRLDLADPFLPLFSGMFAMAQLLGAGGGAVPAQKDLPPERGIAPAVAAGVLLGIASGLIPAAGSPAQAAAFATIVLPMDSHRYLALISSVSMSQALSSFAGAAAIGKSRVGATAVVMDQADVGAMLPVLAALFLASAACAAALIYALRSRISAFAAINGGPLRAVLAAYIALMALAIDGPAGIAVLAASAALGLLNLRLGSERTNLMGALIVPTLMLLFGIRL